MILKRNFNYFIKIIIKNCKKGNLVAFWNFSHDFNFTEKNSTVSVCVRIIEKKYSFESHH